MLGRRIAKLRNSKGLSQYELAEKLGFSRGKLSNYEQGSRQPDYDTLAQIADFFGVTTDFLLGREPNEKETNKEFDPLAEINILLKKYNIDQSGFFDIEKWKAMGPEEIRELESYFEFITSRAKEKNLNDDKKRT